MRLLFALISVLFVGTQALAEDQPTAAEIEHFLRLVETGGIEAVTDALRENPSLATAQGKYEFQAIHVLDYIDFREIFDLLRANGADVNAKNDEGITLLHILIDVEFLPFVLAAGADIEALDSEGRTPLLVHLTEPDNLQMIEALLHFGANPNATDFKGRSVMDYARWTSDDTIISLIQKAGGLR